MTADAITNMRENLAIALKRFEYARNYLGVNTPVNTRNISIAITELETALMWSRRALEVRELSAAEPDIDYHSNEDPDSAISGAVETMKGYINALHEEHKSGASAKWYRAAILNVINSLKVSIMRANMQLHEMD